MSAWAAGGMAHPLSRQDDTPTVMARIFSGQSIDDGTEAIWLDLPHTVDRATPVELSVEVSWPIVPARAAARLFVIADENQVPLLAQVTLPPDTVPPRLSLQVVLEASAHVRAVLAFDDGSLLQTARWVWVLPSGPDTETPRSPAAASHASRQAPALELHGRAPCL